MKTVCFDYSARCGHFLKAEANANGVTYPVPPRTSLLGLIAAVIGLPKDALADELAEARVAVAGPSPRRFWVKVNVRKDPPAQLPWQIKAKDKGTSSEQRNFRFPQEWLWEPRYRVWASLPAKHHDDFAARLRDRRWHFTPCMGLSEMLADLIFVHEGVAESLAEGSHLITSIASHDAGQLDTSAAADAGLTLQSLRMPGSVTADRIFSHRTYWLEFRGRPFPFHTSSAWRLEGETMVFL